MKLKLSRQECGKKSTLGSLTINGVHECWIVEDQDRQLEVNPDAKVYGETCIPRGIYDVIITYSNRFKTPLPLLVGVKGFEGVRIHPGNYAGSETFYKYVTIQEGKAIIDSKEVLEITK